MKGRGTVPASANGPGYNRHRAQGVLLGLEPREAEFDSRVPDQRIVAQLAARLLWEQEDVGSSPTYPTRLDAVQSDK